MNDEEMTTAERITLALSLAASALISFEGLRFIWSLI